MARADWEAWWDEYVQPLVGMDDMGRERALEVVCRLAQEPQRDPNVIRGWVRQMVQRARTRAHGQPGGLLLALLRQGPEATEIEGGEPAPKRKHPAGQPPTPLEELRKGSEHVNEPKPSLVKMLAAQREGVSPRQYMADWEARGCPEEREKTE